jgi:negative regulator of sigma E activity
MIEAYIDNGIDPLDDKVLADHIKSCDECRREFEAYALCSDALKSVKPVKAPEDFAADLSRRIEREIEGSSVFKRVWDFIRAMPEMRFSIEAAGVAALVIIMLIVYKPFTVEEKKYSELEIPVAPAQLERETVKPEKQGSPKSDKKEQAVAEKRKDQLSSIAESEKEYNESPGAMKEEQRGDGDALSRRDEESLDITGSSDEVKMERTESAVTRSKSVYADIRQDSAEDIFAGNRALIIQKETLDGGRVRYNFRIASDRYTLLLKELKADYDVEEISISSDNGMIKAEMVIKKNK